jgi:uncharacterized SAM-binding protein YcdF (DUF218 family)
MSSFSYSSLIPPNLFILLTIIGVVLERLTEAANQYRRLGLPMLVSGGRTSETDDSLAGLMSTALHNDFGISAQWREERSTNTFENAAFSAEVLRRAGVSSAILVTNPWHMARAQWSFHAVGYPVIPAAGQKRGFPPLSAGSFLPQVTALLRSYCALHELLGLGWYRLRYGDW